MNIYMAALVAHANRLAISAHETIDAANRSPYKMCSAEEMTYLRKLVFRDIISKILAGSVEIA